jgi:ABC-type Na+ efflux pump permease subunit
MVRQILVIMEKEWLDIKTTLFSKGNPAAGLLPILLISGAVSVYEPAKIGPAWLQSPLMVFLLVLLVPITVVGFISPDSFVRERRRDTLEPLLATPISDGELCWQICC